MQHSLVGTGYDLHIDDRVERGFLVCRGFRGLGRFVGGLEALGSFLSLAFSHNDKNEQYFSVWVELFWNALQLQLFFLPCDSQAVILVA